jgi:hypothetical protein
MTFRTIQQAVGKQFQAMSLVPTGLFRIDIDTDSLWDTYLASFPEGTNPIFKTRTEHDCSCCRHFVKTLGGVVSIVNGKLVTIWDIQVGGFYQVVADAMASLVRSKQIANQFLHTERMVGNANTRQLLEDKSVKTWDHFFVNLPNSAVVPGLQIGPKLSDSRAAHDVLKRGLTEITLDSIDTVLDLIAQNSLYRGEEHKHAVSDFRQLKAAFGKLKGEQSQDLFAWDHAQDKASVARIRNTVIGTLLTDLSEDKELEDAVKQFETKVAPTNYKRPTALVTKAMVQNAQKTVDELGYTTALERRYATIDDITVNNVMFADRSAKQAMNSVFDEIAANTPVNAKKSLDKVEEVPIEDFISKILPKAESLEVMFENHHAGNLVSLIAPCDPTSKSMFKWPNNFSWSYAGELADSIKERVKRAGGSVTGDLCCRLAWDYADDLDFHMHEPGRGHIYFPNRRSLSPNGGMLDLDANGADGIRSDPAENIVYANRSTMRSGDYVLAVNNYSRRSQGAGFEVEIEFDGTIHRISYDKPLRSGQTVTVASITYTKGRGFQITDSLPSSEVSRTIWGLPTRTFHKVNVLMLSPNYWDEKAVGNKHYFFMLDNCLNEGKARGFFNEFLAEALAPHRKVLEIVGAKMKTEESDRQLSGLGFSSTQRNYLLCRVKGAFTRVIKIAF